MIGTTMKKTCGRRRGRAASPTSVPTTPPTTEQRHRGAGVSHVFGDQIRHRDILTALRDGAQDYSRGFSNVPQLRGGAELAGTEYDDGWGAHCYQQKPKPTDNDASFRSWTCAEGLACQPVSNASRMGMC